MIQARLFSKQLYSNKLVTHNLNSEEDIELFYRRTENNLIRKTENDSARLTEEAP